MMRSTVDLDDLRHHHTHDDIQVDSMTWSVILVLYNSSTNVIVASNIKKDYMCVCVCRLMS